MAGNEIKQALRKLDFPYCVREALSKLGTNISGKQVDLQMDLISEFVFGELDRRKKRNMTMAIQELQLIEIMSDFFQSPGGTLAIRNALFLLLFPADNPRYKTLGNLVSLAIATQNKTVLNAAGIWMQQLGSTSPQSIELARYLLNDYFVLTPSSIDKLKQLPVLAPNFTANLLTAIGEIYDNKDPPIELFSLVGEWINENPSLLLTPLMDNAALPTGGIPMIPITPIAGLLRWCILNPLRDNAKEDTDAREELQKLYSKMQQLLIDSMLRLNNNSGNKHAISVQHLGSIISQLRTMLQNHPNMNKASCDLAIERLAQAISVAISTNCIYGNKQELLVFLQPLSRQHFLIEWALQTSAKAI